MLTFPLCYPFPVGHKIKKLNVFCDQHDISVLLLLVQQLTHLLYCSIGKSCQERFRKLRRRPYHIGKCLSSSCRMLGEEQKCKCQRENNGKGFEQVVQGKLYQLPLSKTCSRCSQVSSSFCCLFQSTCTEALL